MSDVSPQSAARKSSLPQEDTAGGVPEWVVTFGDMMSLLLTFFIMLFSMSEIKQDQHYQDVMDALRKQFGFDRSIDSLIPGDLSRPRNSSLANLSSLGRARHANTMNGGARVRAPVGEQKMVKTPPTAKERSQGGTIYFNEGSDQLTQTAQRDLKQIAATLGGKPQKIEIRGHTTNRPLPEDSPFKDHWDLAYARCRKVQEFLIKQGINPKRLRVSVAGSNEPIHVDGDLLKMRENSRVEVYMVDEFTADIPKEPQ